MYRETLRRTFIMKETLILYAAKNNDRKTGQKYQRGEK